MVKPYTIGNKRAKRGYDADTIVHQAKAAGTQVIIPPKKNRRGYDRGLYKLRYLAKVSND